MNKKLLFWLDRFTKKRTTHGNLAWNLEHKPYPYTKKEIIEAVSRPIERENYREHDGLMDKMFRDPFTDESDMTHMLAMGYMPKSICFAPTPSRFGDKYAKLFDSNENPDGKQILTVDFSPGGYHGEGIKNTIETAPYGVIINGSPQRIEGEFEIYHHGFLDEVDIDCGGIVSTGAGDFKFRLSSDIGLQLNAGAINITMDGKKYPYENGIITAERGIKPKSILYASMGAANLNLEFVDR